MIKAFMTAAVGLLLVSASANAAPREHRAGQPGYTPGGGVTVGTPGQRGGRYGGGSYSGGTYGGYGSTSQVVKVRPAPNVPQYRNWGIPSTTCVRCGTGPSNLRDHRSVRR